MKTHYKSHQAQKLNNLFKMYFGLEFKEFWNGFEPILYGNRFVIDIFKFDEYLIKKYNYKGSMSDFILREFGKDAHQLITNLL